MIAHQFDLECLNVSPSLMGEPVERRRLYICMLRKGKRRCRRWRHELLRQGLGETWQEVFEAVFQRNIVMTAAGKFRAPALGVKNYIAKLAEQQHLPKNTRSGKDWSCFQAVSRAVRDKIQAHQEELARKLLSADLDSGLAATADDPLELRHWTSNVAQQPHFMGPVRGNVPAMLQHTNLWIFGKRRLVLPMEHLEIQGWNILNIWKCRQPISVKHLRSCQQHAGFPPKILRRKRNALPSGWCSHCFSIGCNRRCYSMKEKQPDLAL